MKAKLITAVLLGAATVLGFAPIYLYLLPIVTLVLLVTLLQQAASARAAGWIGFGFGFGFFMAGVSWVYVSLHDYGAMPALLAGFLTVVFCCYLALYTGIVGYLYWALGIHSVYAQLVVVPAIWALGEWMRGTLFTGFPWIAIGYSQIPGAPVAGYAPIFGIYGVSFATVLSAMLIVRAWQASKDGVAERQKSSSPIQTPSTSRDFLHRVRASLWPLTGLAGLWIGGFVLHNIHWTVPIGAPVTISLLQGNVAQEMKWREDRVRSTLENYHELVLASGASLIILPETALPLFLNDIPANYLRSLADHARARNGNVLVGVPERDSAGGYYNSVISVGTSPTQVYRKSHLVPFGEFVPLKPLFGWFLEVTQIPLLDFARGADTQRPLAMGNQLVAVNICYEDAFGQEIIRQLPEATLLVNVSNVAWFGRSLAPRQHLQISQARALETGRYMLRATNTGMTAIIDAHGAVRKVAPTYASATVTDEVQGHSGSTPYVRWGDIPIVTASLLLTLAGIVRFRRKRARNIAIQAQR